MLTILVIVGLSFLQVTNGGVLKHSFDDNDAFKDIPEPHFESLREVPRVVYKLRGDGSYKYGYQLSDQRKEETRNADGEVAGSYAFVDPEGEEVQLMYTAGQKGFLPESKALPQAPQYTNEVEVARREFLNYHKQMKTFLEALRKNKKIEEGDEEDGEESSEEKDDDEAFSSEENDENSSEETHHDDEESSEEDENNYENGGEENEEGNEEGGEEKTERNNKKENRNEEEENKNDINRRSASSYLH